MNSEKYTHRKKGLFPGKGFILKATRVLYFPYQWLIAYPLFAVITMIASLMCMVLVPWKGPKTAGNIAAIPWARMGCWLTPVILTVRGRHHINPVQSYIIAANHQSHFDILIIYGWMGIDFKWVMKESIRKVPFLGHACEVMGHIFIDRSNTKAALMSIQNAKSKIKDGTSIFFFPEGTRSRDGVLKEFKKGAFRMALDLNLPILPVTINGTKNILPKHSSSLFPGKVEMIIHPPIDTAPFTADTLDELVEVVKASIQSKIV